MANLLFEIYTEEIPALYIKPALEQLKKLFASAVEEAGLSSGNLDTYGTPRRLVLWAEGLPEKQEDREVEILGPPESAAYKDGKPTKALEGFARKQDVSIKDVFLVDIKKGKKCAIKKHVKGRTTAEALAEILPETITKISFPKSMRWVEGSKLTFARPVRSILALLGSEVVEFKWNGVNSGRTSYGHPFLAPDAFEVNDADIKKFKENLESCKVILDHTERKEKIENARAEIQGSKEYWMHSKLEYEVTFLTEWPVPVTGQFDRKYLDLPECVIEAALTEHQRYFPLKNKNTKLINKFLFFSNRDKNSEIIKKGNERVLKARLEDAMFFFEKDKKTKFDNFAAQMDDVVYHKDIGTFKQKVERIARLGEFIAKELHYNKEEIEHVKRAARLCKADLATEMVGEFPSLQGAIGAEYAILQGEPEEVADAIKEHYMPAGLEDRMPKSKTGIALAFTDKFDNLAGFFAQGYKPTGAKDPYGLRRAALGIIWIILENENNKNRKEINLSLGKVLEKALSMHTHLIRSEKKSSFQEVASISVKKISNKILNYIAERFRVIQKDSLAWPERCSYDKIDAVIGSSFDNILDVKKRIGAIIELSKNTIWPSLVEIVERTYNIAKNVETPGKPDPALFQEDAEKALFEISDNMAEDFATFVEQEKYGEAAKLYHDKLKKPVHEFFDKVYVNVEDAQIRNNRIALSWAINRLFVENIADLKLIVIPGQ